MGLAHEMPVSRSKRRRSCLISEITSEPAHYLPPDFCAVPGEILFCKTSCAPGSGYKPPAACVTAPRAAATSP